MVNAVEKNKQGQGMGEHEVVRKPLCEGDI